MVAASASLYTNATHFPGAAALVPCLGSALIIHCAGGAHGTSLVGRLLATTPTVWLGKISYSLYLWHWPLFAFAAYEWGELPVAGRLALIAASIALAAATYRWVEQPARTSRIVLTTSRVFAAGLGSAGAVAAVAGIVVATKGLPKRLAPDVAAIEIRARCRRATSLALRREFARTAQQTVPYRPDRRQARRTRLGRLARLDAGARHWMPSAANSASDQSGYAEWMPGAARQRPGWSRQEKLCDRVSVPDRARCSSSVRSNTWCSCRDGKYSQPARR